MTDKQLYSWLHFRSGTTCAWASLHILRLDAITPVMKVARPNGLAREGQGGNTERGAAALGLEGEAHAAPAVELAGRIGAAHRSIATPAA